MTLFWLLIMAAFIACVIGLGWVIREIVGDMTDEIDRLSPFRHDRADETTRPFDYTIDAPEHGHRGDAA